jgi:protein-disulfide isomerase
LSATEPAAYCLSGEMQEKKIKVNAEKDPNCIFCKISAGEIPAKLVAEHGRFSRQ